MSRGLSWSLMSKFQDVTSLIGWFIKEKCFSLFSIFKQPTTFDDNNNEKPEKVIKKKPSSVSSVHKKLPKTDLKKKVVPKSSRKPTKNKVVLPKNTRSSRKIKLKQATVLENGEPTSKKKLSTKVDSRPKRSCVKATVKEPDIQPISKPWKCDLCPEAFQIRSLLWRHVEFQHNKSEIHQCPICDYNSARRGCFINHLKTHDDKRECPVCFKFVSFLENHIRRHGKSVECHICGMVLSGKGVLRTHIERLHQRIREFKCSDCPEAFDSKAELRV